MDEEKKHLPTPARRLQARRDGRFAHSRDLTSAVALLFGLAAIWFVVPSGSALVDIADSSLDPVHEGRLIQGEVALHRFSGFLRSGMILMLPLLLGTWVATILGTWLQSGFQIFSARPMMDFGRIHPGNGFGQLFQGSNIAKTLFGVFKIAVILAVVGFGIQDAWTTLTRATISSSAESPPDGLLQLSEVASTLGKSVWLIGLQCAVALVLLGLADYGFQWWRHEQSLKMTDEELREELKASGSHPQVLAQRRKVREQMSAATRC